MLLPLCVPYKTPETSTHTLQSFCSTLFSMDALSFKYSCSAWLPLYNGRERVYWILYVHPFVCSGKGAARPVPRMIHRSIFQPDRDSKARIVVGMSISILGGAPHGSILSIRGCA